MTAELSPVLFPAADEFGGRIAELRQRMTERGISAFAVVSPENIYYLTGFDHLGYFAFTALLVPVAGPPVMITREMERPTVRAQLPYCQHLTFRDGEDPAAVTARALAELVGDDGVVAVEDEAMFFPPSIRYRLHHALERRNWLNETALLTEMRSVKSATEIDYTRRAAAVSDAAMLAGIASARPGAAEHDVAAAVHHAMFSAGGRPPGFTPLIRPLWMLDQEHVSWGDRTLAAGDGLFLELSGCVRRYHAPMSRTVYIGYLPDGAREAHAAAVEGLGGALAALRPGMRTGEVYDAWRRAVAGSDSRTWPSRHHCGYLVGIGFPPSWVGGGEVLGIRPDGDVEIRAGMTFHLMSWVAADFGPAGHVVSDTALVTATGAELLTTVSRELTVLA